jgi:Complex1_LYR-like
MKSSIATIVLRPNNCRRQLCLQRSFYATETLSSVASQVDRCWSLQHSACNNRFIRSNTGTSSADNRMKMMFSTTSDKETAAESGVLNATDDSRSKILSLYRSIRRIHEKSLPANLRDMGNKYLQSEFRTLKDTTKMTTKHFHNFMMEWEKYRQQLIQSQNATKLGQPLPADVQLTAEQQEQLRKLHQAVTVADSDNKLG